MALRDEILEEERNEREKREAQERARSRSEMTDRTGGWFTKLLLRQVDA
jgi:hypothetical protein